MPKQTSINLLPSTGAEAVFELMTFLEGALAFVVLEASDGTTYEADVPTNGNPIATAADLANSDAWFRIREPGGAGGREWTFQRGSDNTRWRIKASPFDGFVAGSPGATQTPLGNDQLILVGAGTDAAPTYTIIFGSDGSYRWHLVGYDTAEDSVYPWYAWSADTGTGVTRTLMLTESLEAGSYPPLVGTRAVPTSGEPDPAVYAVSFDPVGSDPFVIGNASDQWQSSTTPGRAVYALNDSNGETEKWVSVQFAAQTFSPSVPDIGAPADVANSDGFGTHPLSGQDVLFPILAGRPLGLATEVHAKGLTAHVRMSGVDRSYPDTVTVAGETWAYSATAGLLLPFADGQTPLT